MDTHDPWKLNGRLHTCRHKAFYVLTKELYFLQERKKESSSSEESSSEEEEEKVYKIIFYNLLFIYLLG